MTLKRVDTHASKFLIAGSILGGALFSTPAYGYSDFGNLEYGDCGYEVGANLILHEYPTAKITTNEVVRAWREYGAANAMQYLTDIGFDGHRLIFTSITTKAQVIASAKLGVYAGAWDDTHVVAIIQANPKKLTTLDDGLFQAMTWSNWWWEEDHVVDDYAVSFQTPGTVSVFFGPTSYTSDSPTSMPTQIASIGSSVTIEANAFVNDGYAFEGWTTNPNSSTVQYANDSVVTLKDSTTLYPVWTYTGA